MPVGRLAVITRYPVKSLTGESLPSARVEHRGLAGDRLWAVRDADGKLGSGKSTRRFRRMLGLLELRSRYDGDVPVVSFPDGSELRACDPALDEALSNHVGRPVTLHREADISHFDEGPLHLITTGWLDALSERHNGQVDPRRFRANFLVETATCALDEETWLGHTVRIGEQVVVRPRNPMARCVMVDMAQLGLPADGKLLKTITDVNEMNLGLVVDVVTAGTVRVGDEVTVQ